MENLDIIIKNLGRYNIDIENDYSDIFDSGFSDSEKVSKLAYLIGKCQGLIRCVQLDLINLKEIENAKS
jgi:hypothetical protein